MCGSNVVQLALQKIRQRSGDKCHQLFQKDIDCEYVWELIPTGASETSVHERDPTSGEVQQRLNEIFRTVTGETDLTDPQDRSTQKKVIDVTGSNSSLEERHPDTDPEANGLDDAIGDPEPE